jgi:general secretion pathway protein F/type IV pilus assembly protein PilC
MKFKYRGFDSNGKRVKGKIEAYSIENAKENLKEFYITEIEPIKGFNFDFSFSQKVSSKELSKLFNILATYLKSSIPLITAISLTKNQVENGKILQFLEYLEKSIKEGNSFFNSIETQKIVKLPAYVINTIKVGEESGKLDIVLREISKFLKDDDKLKSKTSKALLYPSFIVIVAIFMIGFMLTNVVPKIVKVFENMDKELPAITKIVISMGNFVQNYWLLILVTITSIVATFKITYNKNYKFRSLIDKLSLKIPLFGKMIIEKELGRFSYLVAVLVGAGVNYITAIKLAINSIENEHIKKIFQTALKDVKEGKKLSFSLQKAGFNFDNSFLQAIALGEETSQIEEVLLNMSELYFEENEEKIEKLLSLLEPTLIVIVGVSIGFIVTAMMLPMFKMSVL